MMNRKAIALMAAADVEDPHALLQLIVERGMLRAREPVVDCVGAGVVAARQGECGKQAAAVYRRHPVGRRNG
ncbi:hypothetical protein ACFFYR_35750 [Paraburkholderia dipogonis]|uniref:hypothetical protein n=1 Tax=Paraburkholderia dipogonis TaxID=1211383 RepID=UPI0031343C72